ncbi:MAG: hypothetical protein JST80_04115 [Bdellovibrionales bacterium]|nr:hypothetical protein [Bdellovibrionales bacterium]
MKTLILLTTALLATTAHASQVTFTATRVVQVSNRNVPAMKLVNHPIRINSDQKVVLVPKTASCAADVCIEQMRYSQLQLVRFQKQAGYVTQVGAHGRIALENGENDATIEIIGANSRTAKMLLVTRSLDGRYTTQATLEGYFTESAF